MKRQLTAILLVAGFAHFAGAAVNVVVSGVVRDAAGGAAPNGAVVALVASKSDAVFAPLFAGLAVRVGEKLSADDEVLAMWAVDSARAGVPGGFLGNLIFDYASMGVSGLGVGDRLMLVWVPGATSTNPVVAPGAAYGVFRSDARINRSDMAWLSPDDSTGGALSLNLLPASLQGDTPDTAIVASQTVGGVLQAPQIMIQPVSVIATAGGAAAFAVTAVGSAPLSYQWRRDRVALSGATGAALSLANVQAAQVGSYDVAVVNPVGNVTSTLVALTIGSGATPPIITAQPQPPVRSVAVGSTATYAVTASGAPAPMYQWSRDSVPIAGATNSTLIVNVSSAAQAGVYSVQVANAAGEAISSLVELRVGSPPVITKHPAGVIVTVGAAISLGVEASGTAPIFYGWSKNGSPISGATLPEYSVTSAALTDAGSYVATASNEFGSTPSNAATVSVLPVGLAASHVVAGAGYFSGRTVTIVNTLAFAAPVTELSWSVTLPNGWSFAAADSGDTRPQVGTTGVLVFTWQAAPAGGRTFAYALNVPATTTGTQSLDGIMQLKQDNQPYSILAKPAPLLVPKIIFHSADTMGSGPGTLPDGRINLAELLRVIELYNHRAGTVRTGQYTLQTGTDDGFAPGPLGTALTRFHSADTMGATPGTPPDGRLNLAELLRVIELYNYRAGTVRTGQYRVLANTDDGFAPGP